MPPAGEEYYGVQLDWAVQSPKAYAARLGRVPYDYGDFASLPLSNSERQTLDKEVSQIAALHSKFFLTIEMPDGLGIVTPSVAQSLARQLARWNAEGVGIFLRFGQEMNGSWYPWGQQPALYVAKFRLVATYVHRLALGTVMVWSPNTGDGYPFAGGEYSVKPGTPAFKEMDTNGAAQLSMYDDPYGPYYPGDAYVDWVGLSNYDFGDTYPYGANTIPEPNKFVEQMTGTYIGNEGNDTMLPNFYKIYAVDHHKPMAISETAALYNEKQAGIGASDIAIETNWIDQVFNPAVRAQFPKLGMVNWFEWKKNEEYGYVDWRATAQPQILAALVAALSSGYIFSAQTVQGA